MNKTITSNYDFIVVGGGMSGLCSAIAAARHGVKTAIIHDRPVLGGNASSEIRMHISGASYHDTRKDARETGILEEFLLENKYKNPHYTYPEFDAIVWGRVRAEDNIDLFLNTHMISVETDKLGTKVDSIGAVQLTTGKHYTFTAPLFMDGTGDATLAYLAGANYMVGREEKAKHNEIYAPEIADSCTMGSTLLFTSRDTGAKVKFHKPEWANTYTEEDLVCREHSAHGHNYWWIELGGVELNTIDDAEEIRDGLLKAVYGVWDHIKNGGEHGAENFVLDWVGFLPGKRESRRVVGDYKLTESDLFNAVSFKDSVAYGGWPMDMHVVGGLTAKVEPTQFIVMDNLYNIPYRCLYSNNIQNLFVGGRAISTSHMAFGSTRVMGTCSVIGHAIGIAAHLATKYKATPKEVGTYMTELQQILLREDAYIIGIKNTDSNDLAKLSTVIASSYEEGAEPEKVINGISRNIKDQVNCWISDKNEVETSWIGLNFKDDINPHSIELKFDSNLSQGISMSVFSDCLEKQSFEFPKEMVKDYTVILLYNEIEVYRETVHENYLRYRVHKLDKDILCNKIKIEINGTHGEESARIFEIRVY